MFVVAYFLVSVIVAPLYWRWLRGYVRRQWPLTGHEVLGIDYFLTGYVALTWPISVPFSVVMLKLMESD